MRYCNVVIGVRKLVIYVTPVTPVTAGSSRFELNDMCFTDVWQTPLKVIYV